MNMTKAFVSVFEPYMKEKGFQRKGKVFHRIVNGKIVQLLSYYKYFQAPEFTVQFLIYPLCTGTEYSLFRDDTRMCEVFDDVPLWEYEYGTDGYVELMPAAFEAAQQRLFPFFDLIKDYESYIQHIEDIRSLNITSNPVYSVNLVLGNYEISEKSRETYIAYRKKAFREKWGTDHHIVPSTQEEFDKDCQEYYRMKVAIENNDREYIEDYIKQQERKSLNSYVKTFSTPRKYKIFLETGVLPFEFIKI